MIKKPDIPKGKIIGCVCKTKLTINPRTWISWLLRKWEGVDYNHVYILHHDRAGRLWVYESDVPKGVSVVLWDNYKKKNQEYKFINYNFRVFTYDRMVRDLGKNYDILSIVRHFFNRNGWVKTKTEDHARYCSEYFAHSFGMKDYYKIGLKELDKYVMKD